MKIVVCVKQVLALGDEVEFTDDGRDVDPDFLELSLNEWDAHATEEALRIRERSADGAGGEVVVVTVGDESAADVLRRCLAMGADRAIRVEAGPGALADPITVARALAEPVRAEQPDLVLTGVQSSDSVQAATGTALAELLGLPRVAVVTRIDHTDGEPTAVVHRELEGGLVDVTEVDVPALLTVQTGINEPRYANLRAIKQAREKELAVVRPSPAGQPACSVRRMYAPPRGEGARMLDGEPAEIAARIAEIVKERLS
ncbi:MAG: electron transfer flavoprotein subunit beta/FixA family protein [Nocardiopsaceae bacterium]|nr:electron transfer flavoprotein subunit beta/FixA family protein [Nocardiopsaceae bacterium]